MTTSPLVKELRESVFLRARTPGRGVCCPVCDRYVKIYRRPLNATMARVLLCMYRLNKASPGAFHHVIENTAHIKASPQFAVMKHWGFIERRADKRDDGNPDTGFWRITDVGIAFAELRARHFKFALLYNNVCHGFSGAMVDLVDVLGTKFNYQELLRG